jgi:hypothetical protein
MYDMRKLLVVLIAALGMWLVPSAAQAAITFHAGPTFTDLGTTLNVTGDVSGLGNENLTVRLDATGVGSVTCANPAGNIAPGQDTSVNASGTQSDIEVKNGRAVFDVTTAEPPAPDPAVVCPNRKWTATITDVEFSSATLTLLQGGMIVFQQTFTL